MKRVIYSSERVTTIYDTRNWFCCVIMRQVSDVTPLWFRRGLCHRPDNFSSKVQSLKLARAGNFTKMITIYHITTTWCNQSNVMRANRKSQIMIEHFLMIGSRIRARWCLLLVTHTCFRRILLLMLGVTLLGRAASLALLLRASVLERP